MIFFWKYEKLISVKRDNIKQFKINILLTKWNILDYILYKLWKV